MPKLEVEVTRIIKKRVSVKFPTLELFDDEDDKYLCLLDSDALKDYNCSVFNCNECYFGLSVVTELSDVPDQ